ncbi:hypothetical protein [Streptomyces sp. NBC_01304]|uniref:hypothetical protein n=1 Tax=Streptomyces sp. NBC_01304 TaxID=2903818 RepID=UPI002E118790|nr:hypothetical protein OG430_40925 [Streptomyces sp. NBC_01304]
MAAIEDMIDTSDQVGPLLCCSLHLCLIVPVKGGTADVWKAAHSECEAGPAPRCTTQHLDSRCPNRFWATPSAEVASDLTDAAALHHRLSLMRTRMRDADRHSLGARAGELCHD